MGARVLFDSQFYVACLTVAGLTVQSKRKEYAGRNMKPDHAQYAQWVTALDSCDDAKEGNDLCCAFLSP